MIDKREAPFCRGGSPMGFAKSFVASVTILTMLAPAVRAQEQGKFESVRFRTADGVTIKGSFYPGENTNAATVILLHNLNENRKKKNWLNLAVELQKKGYAVLTFDFRGHGDSTSVDPEVFWSKQHPFNHMVRKGQEIDNKFDKRYLPALVNDIAAAKAFLDKKNDAKECNSSRIILIGAETGATLGALWLKSEWQRYRVKMTDFGKPWLDRFGRPYPDLTKPPEGSAVINCIWLSISPTLGSRTVDLGTLLAKAARERAVPMAFMYSNEDKSGKTVARNLESRLVVYVTEGGKKVRDKKYRYTAAWEIESGKLKGQELLQKKIIEGIVNHLDDSSKDRGEDWMDRDFRKTAYVWYFGPTVPVLIAKRPDEMNLLFSSYENFLR
jgi:alpha-beta hydrolase superfamily lysophospholipase